jgi:hypothetical protein
MFLTKKIDVPQLGRGSTPFSLDDHMTYSGLIGWQKVRHLCLARSSL